MEFQEGQQYDAKTIYALQMQAWAFVQGGGPQPDRTVPEVHVDTRLCYKCGEAGHLAGKCPYGGPFVPRPDPEPKAAPAPKIQAPAISFVVHGDTLMQTRYEGKSKSAKKARTFKADFEGCFWEAFGNSSVEYTVDGHYIKDVIYGIKAGPDADIMVVGITCNELIVPWEKQRKPGAVNEILMNYPASLDKELESLAHAILSKSKGSLVLCGGPASMWNYPPRWDVFVERASNTIRRAGVQVVPRDTANAVMERMELAEDGVHFAHNDTFKQYFAQAWKDWLLIAAQDKTFGRTISEDPEEEKLQGKLADMVWKMPQAPVTSAASSSSREHSGRSRSPPRTAARAPFFFPGAAAPPQAQAQALALAQAARVSTSTSSASGGGDLSHLLSLGFS